MPMLFTGLSGAPTAKKKKMLGGYLVLR